jgi:hypothetical protein
MNTFYQETSQFLVHFLVRIGIHQMMSWKVKHRDYPRVFERGHFCHTVSYCYSYPYNYPPIFSAIGGSSHRSMMTFVSSTMIILFPAGIIHLIWWPISQ